MTSSGTSAQLEAVAQPGEDGLGARPGQDAQADEEAGVVVDEADDPDLRVVAGSTLQEEGPLDVDVPELVGSAALVGRATLAVDSRPRGPVLAEDMIDRVVVERVDVPARELRGEALAVPVRQEAHHDDDPLDPGRQPLSHWSSWSRSEGLDATLRIGPAPAMQAGPARTEGQGRRDTVPVRGAHAADAEAQPGEVLPALWFRWPSAAGGQEEEVGSLLVGVTERSSMRVGACAITATLRTSPSSCLTNLRNYN